MIIAHGKDDDDGGKVVIFGITPENIASLQAGKPINIRKDNPALASAGLQDVRVVIMYGLTLEAIAASLPTGPQTQKIDHRRKPQ